MFKKLSLFKLIKLIPLSLALFSSLVLSWLSYQVYLADLDYFLNHIKESHESQLNDLESFILKEIQNLSSLLTQKAILHSEKELLYLEQNQDKLANDILLQIMSEDELENYLSQGIKPLFLRVYRLQNDTYKTIKQRFNDLFDPKITQISEIKKARHSIYKELDKANIQIEFNDLSQLVALKYADYLKLAKIAENRPNEMLYPDSQSKDFDKALKYTFPHIDFIDGRPDLGQEPMNRRLFLNSEDHLTSIYPISENNQNELVNDPDEMPMLWVAGYVGARISRFGPINHPLYEMLEKNKGFQPLNSRGRLFPIFDSQIGWELYPYDYLDPKDTQLIPLMPQRIIAFTRNDKILSRHFLKSYVKEQQKTTNFINFHLDKQITNNNPFFFIKQNGRNWLCSSLKSAYLSELNLEFCSSAEPKIFKQNLSKDEFNFATKWRIYLVLVVLAIFLSFKLSQNFFNKIIFGLKTILDSILITQKPVKYFKSNILEIEKLISGVKQIKENIALHNLNFALFLGLQEIINQPGKSLSWYLEEMQYFIRESADSLEYKLNLNSNNNIILNTPKIADSTKRLLDELMAATKIKADLELKSLENEGLAKEIELGLTLQKNLLPKDFDYKSQNFTYKLDYQINYQKEFLILLVIEEINNKLSLGYLKLVKKDLGDLIMANSLKVFVKVLLRQGHLSLTSLKLKQKPLEYCFLFFNAKIELEHSSNLKIKNQLDYFCLNTEGLNLEVKKL